jgi:hypothetical protein
MASSASRLSGSSERATHLAHGAPACGQSDAVIVHGLGRRFERALAWLAASSRRLHVAHAVQPALDRLAELAHAAWPGLRIDRGCTHHELLELAPRAARRAHARPGFDSGQRGLDDFLTVRPSAAAEREDLEQNRSELVNVGLRPICSMSPRTCSGAM